MTNNDIEDVRKLSPQNFNKFHSEVTHGLLREEMPILLIEYKGKKYGFPPFKAKTIGEVADTEEFFREGDKTAILKTILREVISHDDDLEWESLGLDNEGLEVRVVRIGDITKQYNKIKLYDYDANKQLDDDSLLDFPYAIYASIIAFTLGTGMPFMINSPSCSQEVEVEMIAKAVTKFVQTEASFRQLCILRKLGY